MRNNLLLIPLLSLAVGAAATAKPAWEKTGSDDGITTYARSVPHSDVREVKAVTVLDHPPAQLLKAINDFEHYTEFMPYMEESRVLDRREKAAVVYFRLDTPFVSDRDYTLLLTERSEPDKGIFRIEWEGANDRGPAPVDGVVRVETNRGSWTLEALEGGAKSRVTYYVYTNPGGSIPSWIANKANKTALTDVVRAVDKRASR